MDLRLEQINFVDGRFSQSFGANKKATFIVVQESFPGNNNLGVVDRINIFIETFNPDGTKESGSFSTSIIGVGDGIAGILTDNTELLGQVLKWDNMEECVIRLYEQ